MVFTKSMLLLLPRRADLYLEMFFHFLLSNTLRLAERMLQFQEGDFDSKRAGVDAPTRALQLSTTLVDVKVFQTHPCRRLSPL